MFKKTLTIIKTSRPLFGLNHISLFLFGATSSANFYFSTKLLPVFFLLFFVFSLFIYALNDFYDQKSDSLNPRKGGQLGITHSKKTAKKLLTWTNWSIFASLLISLVFLPIKAFLVLLTTGFFLYFYSAPPLRFKSIPILDILTGGLIYAAGISITGYLYFENSLFPFNQIPNNVVFVIFGSIIFQAMALMIDYLPDKKQGIKTSAVYFGQNRLIIFCAILMPIAAYLLKSNPLLFYPFILSTPLTILYLNQSFRQTKLARIFIMQGILYGFFILALIKSFQA